MTYLEKNLIEKNSVSLDFLESIIEDTSLLDNLSPLMKYVVAKCLAEDLCEQKQIDSYIKKLKKAKIYNHFEKQFKSDNQDLFF